RSGAESDVESEGVGRGLAVGPEAVERLQVCPVVVVHGEDDWYWKRIRQGKVKVVAVISVLAKGVKSKQGLVNCGAIDRSVGGVVGVPVDGALPEALVVVDAALRSAEGSGGASPGDLLEVL